MDKLTIYSHEGLVISVDEKPAPACIQLLKRTQYGTNGIRYYQTGQEQKINDLKKPLFFHLELQGELIGMYCLDERQLGVATGYVKGFYGRYLAIDQQHAGKGYGQLVKNVAVHFVTSIISEPHVFYSYIEEQNTRSMRISERQGFASASTLGTYIFRRYSPKSDSRFSSLKLSEVNELKSRLTDYYRHHTFRTFAGIGYSDNYYALKEGGEILAGVQANQVQWRFAAMPGVGGWMTMNLVPLLPATRRFFNLEAYSFVALEGIYLKPGYEHLLYPLLESTLAEFGLHSALWLIDDKDPIRQLLSQPGSGLLSGFQKGIKTHVMVKEEGLSVDKLQTAQPMYVSSFDFV